MVWKDAWWHYPFLTRDISHYPGSFTWKLYEHWTYGWFSSETLYVTLMFHEIFLMSVSSGIFQVLSEIFNFFNLSRVWKVSVFRLQRHRKVFHLLCYAKNKSRSRSIVMNFLGGPKKLLLFFFSFFSQVFVLVINSNGTWMIKLQIWALEKLRKNF